MKAGLHRNGILVAVFALILMVIVMLAFSSTTWAAPGAQGTVPTAPAPTSTGGDNGGNNNGGDNNNNNNNNNNGGGDNGGSNAGTDQGNTNNSGSAAPGTGSVCAISDAGAQCSLGDLVIVAGAGAADPGSALTIEGSFAQPPCPASPAGENFLDRCYRYSWIGTNAQPLSSIKAPVQYCIGYGDSQLAVVKNNPEGFLIGVAGGDGNWTMLKPTADAVNNRVCATTDQLIVWSALFAPKSASDLLPTVGMAVNNWSLAVLMVVGGALVLVAARLRRTN